MRIQRHLTENLCLFWFFIIKFLFSNSDIRVNWSLEKIDFSENFNIKNRRQSRIFDVFLNLNSFCYGQLLGDRQSLDKFFIHINLNWQKTDCGLWTTSQKCRFLAFSGVEVCWRGARWGKLWRNRWVTWVFLHIVLKMQILFHDMERKDNDFGLADIFRMLILLGAVCKM